MSTVFKQIATDPVWEAILAELVANNTPDEEIQKRKEEYDAEKAAAAEEDEDIVQTDLLPDAEVIETQDDDKIPTPGVFTPTDEEVSVEEGEEDVVEEDAGEEDAGEEVAADDDQAVDIVEPVATDEVTDVIPTEQKGVDYDEIGESLGIFQDLAVQKDAKQKELKAAQEAGAPQETIDALGAEYHELATQHADLANTLNLPAMEADIDAAEVVGVKSDATVGPELFNTAGTGRPAYEEWDLIESLEAKHPDFKFNKTKGEGGVVIDMITPDGSSTTLDVSADPSRAYLEYASAVARSSGAEEGFTTVGANILEEKLQGYISKYKPEGISADEWLTSLAPEDDWAEGVGNAFSAILGGTRSEPKRGGITRLQNPELYEIYKLLYDFYTKAQDIREKTVSIDEKLSVAETIFQFWKLEVKIDKFAEKHNVTVEEAKSMWHHAEGNSVEEKLENMSQAAEHWPDFDVREYERILGDQIASAWADDFAEQTAEINLKYHDKIEELQLELLPEFKADAANLCAPQFEGTIFEGFSTEDIIGAYTNFAGSEIAQTIALKILQEETSKYANVDEDPEGDPEYFLTENELETLQIDIQGKIKEAILKAENEFHGLLQKSFDNFRDSDARTIKLNEDWAKEITEKYRDYSFNYEIKTDHIDSEYFDTITWELDSIGFGEMGWVDQKIILNSILSRDFGDRFKQMNPIQATEIKEEFWAYFYHQAGMGRSKEGVVGHTLFAHKDVAENLLAKSTEEIEKTWDYILGLIGGEGTRFPNLTKKWGEMNEDERASVMQKMTNPYAFAVLPGDEATADIISSLATRIHRLQDTIDIAKEILNTEDPEFHSWIYNFFNGLFSGEFPEYIPILGGLWDLNDLAVQYKIASKDQSEWTEAERLYMTAVGQKAAAEQLVRDKSKAFRVGEMGMESWRFVWEMVLTSGVYSGTKRVVKKKLRNHIVSKIRDKSSVWYSTMSTKSAITTANRLAWFPSVATALTAQSGTMQQNIIGSTFENMTPELIWCFSEESDEMLDALLANDAKSESLADEYGIGSIKIDPTHHPDGFMPAYTKGYLIQMIEMGTERLGFHGARLSKKALEKMGMEQLERILQRVSLAQWLRKKGIGKSDLAVRISKGASMQSIFWEIAEEEPATTLSNMVMNGWDGPWFSGQLTYDLDPNSPTYGDITGIDYSAQTDMFLSVGFMTGSFNTVANVTSRNNPYYLIQDTGEVFDQSQRDAFEKRVKELTKDGKAPVVIFGGQYDTSVRSNIEDLYKMMAIDPSKIKVNSLFQHRASKLLATYAEIVSSLGFAEAGKYKELIKQKLKLQEELEAAWSIENTINRRGELERINKAIKAINVAINQIPGVKEIKSKIFKERSSKEFGITNSEVLEAIENASLESGLQFEVAENAEEASNIILDWILQNTIKNEKGEYVPYKRVLNEQGVWDSILIHDSEGNVRELTLKEQTEIFDQVISIRQKGDGFSGVYRGLSENPDGKALIVVNKSGATTLKFDEKTGEETTGDPYAAKHELGHHILYKLLQESPEMSIVLGNILYNYLDRIDPNQIKDSKLKEKLEKIRKARSSNAYIAGEETLTTFVSLLNMGYFVKNETLLMKLGSMFDIVFSSTNTKIELETSEDVYNFLVDFNRNIGDGILSEGIQNLTRTGDITIGEDIEKVQEGVKVGLEDWKVKAKEQLEGLMYSMTGRVVDPALIDAVLEQHFKFSEEISDEEIQQSYEDSSVDSQKVQDIYAGKDTNPNWQYDIMQAYGGMIRKMFDSNLATAPSDDIENLLINNKEDIISDLEMEVLVLTTTFNPDNQKFGNIAAYINGLLNKRKFGIFDKYAGAERQGTTGLETPEGVMKPGVEGTTEDAKDADYTTDDDVFIDPKTGLPLTVNVLDAVIIGENSEESKEDIKNNIKQSEVDYNTLLEARDVQEVPMPRVVQDLVLANTNPNPNTSKGVEFTGPLAPAFRSFCEAIIGKGPGVDDFMRRIVSGQTFTNSQRNAIRNWITSSVDEETGEYNLLKLLPLHHTPNGDAVGVFETILHAFYTDLSIRGATDAATKAGKVGMDAKGLPLWEINEDLGKEDIDALLGINPDGTYAKGTSWDQLLKALVKQYAVEAIRQEIKIPAEGIVTDQIWSILSEGKGEFVFSEIDPSEGPLTIDGVEIDLDLVNKFANIEEPIISKYKGNRLKTSELMTIWRSGFDELKKVTNPADIDSVKRSIGRIYANHPEILELTDELAARMVAAWKPLMAKLVEGKTRPTDKQLFDALIKGTESSTTRGYVTGEGAAIELSQDPMIVAKMKDIDIAVVKNIMDEAIKSGDPEAIEKALRMAISLKAHGTSSPSRIGYWRNYDAQGNNLGHSEGWYDGVFGKNGSAIEGLEFELTDKGIKASSIKINGKPLSELLGRKVDISGLSMKADVMITETGDQRAKRQEKELEAIEALNIWVEYFSSKYKEKNSGIGTNEIQVAIAAQLSSMQTILSQAARYKWDQPGLIDLLNEVGKADFNKNQVIVEHMQPRLKVILALFNEHINRDGLTTEEAFEFLENYEIALIDKKFDEALKALGVQKDFAPGQTMSDPSWFRYFRTLHPDLKPIQNKDTGKVLQVAEAVSKALNALNAIGVDISNAESVEMANQLLTEYFDAKDEEVNGASVWDFDDTLARTESQVYVIDADGKVVETLSAEDFANDFLDWKAKGYEFDFSDFNKVVDGKPGPFLQKLRDRIDKYGIDNMFILTARAPQSQEAILEFMEALGINFPAENVIGLGRSEGIAKAEWIANNLILAGYNELYFADDAPQNVEAVSDMFELFNVDGKVELANQEVIDNGEFKFSEIIKEGEKDLSGDAKVVGLSEDLNIIVEETTGTERQKQFSAAKAKERGKDKSRFKFFIPPSAEDFEGLIYSLLGKGEVGEKHHEWFKKHLFDPYSEGIRNLNIAQQTVANSAKQLKKQMPDAVKKAKQPVRGLKEYTYETAIRVYNWVKNGIEVPGLTKTDQDKLIKAVENDPDLLAYALATEVVMSQAGGYVNLENNVGWLAGSIDGDMVRSLAQARESFLATWIENKNIIFSEANLNKIEAVYGAPYRKALEDSLWRMETGSHRSASTDDTTQRFMNWINGSIGTTMFFNARSALLQMLSSVNFINWEDNNMLKAGAAFANQPQYWADVNMIFHSDYLKQRRGGDEFDVNLADFANELSKAKNPMAVVIGKLIQLGYTPTKFADSLAIATGGATFYRNRVNTYISQGMSKSKAEAQAFLDMQEIAESTQQSARPDKISQIQASPLGKIVFAFQNTPMQYARIIKKAVLDLVNGRGDAKSHISKIIYYGAIQNVIFYGLQTALFAFMFDDDEEESKDVAYARTLNGMVDSLLRGSGLPGAVIATAKNIVLEFFEQQDKAQPDHAYTVLEALNISPPVGIKARNMYNTLQTWEYNEDVANQMELTDFDNPLWSASTQAVQVATNLPTNKIYNKIKNVREALNTDHETWKRIAMFLGWSSWSLGIESEEITEAEAEIKEQKKEERYLEKLFEEQVQIEENIEKQNEERKDSEVVKCAAVNKEGVRCSNEALPGENFCTIHKPVPQQDNEVQCSHIKKNGNRCKMMTKNKSGKCYYHD